GKFTHWPLPPGVGAPDRLVAGADGAIWFTGRHAIARITPAGEVASFPLAGHAAPHDIVAGPEGALWVVSAAGLGRGPPAGAVPPCPLAGALRLERIADAERDPPRGPRRGRLRAVRSTYAHGPGGRDDRDACLPALRGRLPRRPADPHHPRW